MQSHINKLLGKGSFGQVYGDGKIAVKKMEIKKNSEEEMFANFELAATLGFDDLNIV